MAVATLRPLLALTLATLLAACGAPAPPPSPLTDIDADVVGYDRPTDAQVVARDAASDAVLASGTLDADASHLRLSLTPPDQVPQAAYRAFWDDPLCAANEVTASPSELRAAAVSIVSVVGGGGFLWLATYDPSGAAAVGDRLYNVYLADRAGRIEGACTYSDGSVLTYQLDLVQGWNMVELEITATGDATAVLVQARDLAEGARWHFVATGGGASGPRALGPAHDARR